MIRALTILLFCLAAVAQDAPPPLPALPVRTSATKSLLAPRQATVSAQAVAGEMVDVVLASRISGGVQSNWWGRLYRTNLAALRIIDVTNAPATVATMVRISWPERVKLLTSPNATDWSEQTFASRRVVAVPMEQMGFFRVPVPMAQAWLEWKPSPSFQVTGYKVYQGPWSGAYVTNYDVGFTTTFAMTNLVPDQKYFFVVTAHDAAGTESPASNEVLFTAPIEEVPAEIDIY